MRGIRNWRQRQGLTQSELAAAIGVNQATVSKWEREVTEPRSKFLLRIADFLGCPMEALFIETFDPILKKNNAAE